MNCPRRPPSTEDSLSDLWQCIIPQKIISLKPNLAFANRIDAEINVGKNRRLKIIFCFDPVLKENKAIGKIGIITAFVI